MFLTKARRWKAFHMSVSIYNLVININQGCTNPRRQVAAAHTFHTVAPKICGSSQRNLLRVILLSPRIMRWLLDVWKICAPLTLT